MDTIRIADEIEKRIRKLEEARRFIRERAEKKAETIANYDKKLAMTIMALQSGREYELDGEKIKDPKASYLEKVAKGICYKERMEMDVADGLYKSVISNIDSLQAELNGWQSIYRHLAEK